MPINLSKSDWGRIWAYAFTNTEFRHKLERGEIIEALTEFSRMPGSNFEFDPQADNVCDLESFDYGPIKEMSPTEREEIIQGQREIDIGRNEWHKIENPQKIIKPTDWGRIYAYLWNHKDEYQARYEKNPLDVIKEIAREKLSPPIDFDILFKVEIPEDYTLEQRDFYISLANNTNPYWRTELVLRETC